MEMVCYQLGRCSYEDSLKVIEADIHHANALAAAIPNPKGKTYFQMKLVYNQWAPLFFLLLQWVDSSCSCFFPLYFNLFHVLVYEVYPDGRPNMSTQGSKATVREFYAILLPSLRRIHEEMVERESRREGMKKKKKVGQRSNYEEECGICMEACTQMVLPTCCHSMCINCFRDWNTRSESCPFCRGRLRRVRSEDLWVLPCDSEVLDPDTVTHEELSRFYLYIQSLPKDSPDALFLMYYEYLI